MFQITGTVTSMPATIAVWVLARPPVICAYLTFAFIGAVFAGISFGSGVKTIHILMALQRRNRT